MIIFIVLLFILCCYKIKPLCNKQFHQDYIGIEQTRSINGIFILLILLSHTFAKVSTQGILDELYSPIRVFLGQFVVVPFLFYSGYGIMESIGKKENYIKTFPRKRFLKIAVQFCVITIVYVVMHLLLRSEYTWKEYLLSFTGITSIGNGGWYILSLFVFYLSIIICFNLFKNNKVLATIAVTLCLIALMVVEMALDFPTYYYSTTIFFAVGMYFSLIKKHFDKIVMKNNVIYCVCLAVSIAGFALSKILAGKTVLFYPIWCGFGMLAILLLTMKVKIGNVALSWCGKAIFFIFTLQGIPQILFTKFLQSNYIIYPCVIISTIAIAFFVEKLVGKLEKKLSAKKEKDKAQDNA